MIRPGKSYGVIDNRENKARKIELLLEEFTGSHVRQKKILDIGTGAGVIAEYFAKSGNDVTGVDVWRQWNESERKLFDFVLVEDEKLPFSDRSFDIIISNHIAEHTPNPIEHLREMKRVLKDDGVVYFAMPDRKFPFELHTRTWFVHWLPFKAYYAVLKRLRISGNAVVLYSGEKMKEIIKSLGYKYAEQTINILRNPAKYKMKGSEIIGNIRRLGGILSIRYSAFHQLPKWIEIFSPTRIFILMKTDL